MQFKQLSLRVRVMIALGRDARFPRYDVDYLKAAKYLSTVARFCIR